MGKVFVYVGCYDMYVTDKEMPKSYALCGEFDSVPDAESFVEENDGWLCVDRDLIKESCYCWDNEDYDTHTFDYNEFIGK